MQGPRPHLSPAAPGSAFDSSLGGRGFVPRSFVELGNTFIYVLRTKMQQDASLSKSGVMSRARRGYKKLV